MIDIVYFINIFNLVLNTISTIFTLLFILYRFTSLFSYMLGFIKFCGRIINGIFYVKNNIYYYTSGYSYKSVNEENENDNKQNKSIFGSIGSYVSKAYYYVFPKKKEYNVLPVYEIRESYIRRDNDIVENDDETEKNILNNQINQLMNYDKNSDDEESDDESLPFLSQNSKAIGSNVINNSNNGSSLSSLYSRQMSSIKINSTYNNYSGYNGFSEHNENENIYFNYQDETLNSDMFEDNKNSIMLQEINPINHSQQLSQSRLKMKNDNLSNSNMYLNFDFIKKNLNKNNDRDNDQDNQDYNQDIVNKFQNLSL